MTTSTQDQSVALIGDTITEVENGGRRTKMFPDEMPPLEDPTSGAVTLELNIAKYAKIVVMKYEKALETKKYDDLDVDFLKEKVKIYKTMLEAIDKVYAKYDEE